MANLFSLSLMSIMIKTLALLEIPEYVYESCQFVDICNRTVTARPPAGKVSCCKPCSCNESCGLYLNCCFDYQDKYKLMEKGNVQCIEPIIGHSNTQNRIKTSSFYMVVSCAYLDPFRSQNETRNCQLFDKNNRSQLAPVTNMESKTTYFNEECAKCNNVDKFVRWNYYYFGNSSYIRNFASILWTIETGFELQKGYKVFTPPQKVHEVIIECYNDFNGATCEGSSPYYNICTTLNIPFKVSKIGYTFKNVACFHCRKNAIYSEEPEFCDITPYVRSYSTVSLAVLLDRSIIDSIQRKPELITTSGNCPPETLKSQILDLCLPLYCPEGMYRTKNGCKYLFLSWNIGGVTIQVKLVPDESTLLPVSDLQELTKAELDNPQRWIKPPCEKLGRFYYDIHYENSSLQYVKSFMVLLTKFTDDDYFSPTNGIPLLERCSKDPWFLHLNNTKYKFKPHLSKFVNYVPDGRNTIRMPPLNMPVDFVRPKIYDVLMDSDVSFKFVRRPNINIKKTFFCDQVRLPLDEVELRIEEVHILATNKTLGNGEYDFNDISLVDKTVDANYSSVSICVDDYITQNGGTVITGYVFLVLFVTSILDFLALAIRKLA